jgi:tight adherence protein B
MKAWLASGCLMAAAIVVAWPRRSSRVRLGLLSHDREERRIGAVLLRRAIERVETRGAVVAGGGLAGAVGLALAGPVGGTVAAVYGALGVRAVGRRRRRSADAAGRLRALENLGAIAAELRAGRPAGADLLSTFDTWKAERGGPSTAEQQATAVLIRRARAAVSLAATTGAPLADLLDRVEADARATDRLRMAASAQAAGARATAWLLAVLPLAGLGLGGLIGADPLHVLLRTPVGAACAVVAVALQIAGLGWTARLVSTGSAR